MDTGAGFGWTELSAADPDVAARFFARFLGWERDVNAFAGRSQPIEYSLLTLRGRNVAGLYPMVAAQRKRGAKPQWLSYLFVPEVSTATERARALGATVLAEPMEVFELGRMALLRDPAGAVFGLWQARRLGPDFQTRDAVGFASWFEHVSADVPVAARFYAELCGWSARRLASDGPERTVLERHGLPVGGVSALPGDALSAQWLTFFRVTDCAAACQQLVLVGGSLILPPLGAPSAGQFALARDAQGAPFGLMTPAVAS